jgi:hypothetical protein
VISFQKVFCNKVVEDLLELVLILQTLHQQVPPLFAE